MVHTLSPLSGPLFFAFYRRFLHFRKNTERRAVPGGQVMGLSGGAFFAFYLCFLHLRTLDGVQACARKSLIAQADSERPLSIETRPRANPSDPCRAKGVPGSSLSIETRPRANPSDPCRAKGVSRIAEPHRRMNFCSFPAVFFIRRSLVDTLSRPSPPLFFAFYRWFFAISGSRARDRPCNVAGES